jgi:hypothetical protein
LWQGEEISSIVFVKYGKMPANAEKNAKRISIFEQVWYNTRAIN